MLLIRVFTNFAQFWLTCGCHLMPAAFLSPSSQPGVSSSFLLTGFLLAGTCRGLPSAG